MLSMKYLFLTNSSEIKLFTTSGMRLLFLLFLCLPLPFSFLPLLLAPRQLYRKQVNFVSTLPENLTLQNSTHYRGSFIRLSTLPGRFKFHLFQNQRPSKLLILLISANAHSVKMAFVITLFLGSCSFLEFRFGLIIILSCQVFDTFKKIKKYFIRIVSCVQLELVQITIGHNFQEWKFFFQKFASIHACD